MRNAWSGLVISLVATPALAAAAAACPPLTPLQEFAGLINLANIGWFFAIAAGSVCALILLSRFVVVFAQIPKEVWEALGYIAGVALLFAKLWMPNSFGSLVTDIAPVVGALLFGGMIALSGLIREVEPNPTAYFTILMVLYAGFALWYQSTPIGFLAIIALMGLFGFTVFSGGLSYVVGFESEERLPSATVLALGLVTLVLAVQANNLTLGYANVFILGATWLGSIVGGIGLLVSSSVWYGYDQANRRPMYVVMQFVAIAHYALGIYFGAVYGNDVIMYASAVFLTLYLLEKPHEWTEGIIAHATIGLISALLVGWGAWWLQNNLAAVQAYISAV